MPAVYAAPVSLGAEFSDRAIRSGGLTLFQARDALQIVRAAQERGIIVHGLEAFIAWKDGIQPYLEHTIDTDPADNPWRAASEFLAEYRDTSFVFEIALDQSRSER